MKELLPALFVLGVIGFVIYYMMFKRKPSAESSPAEQEVVEAPAQPQAPPPSQGTPTETAGKGAGGTAVPKP